MHTSWSDSGRRWVLVSLLDMDIIAILCMGLVSTLMAVNNSGLAVATFQFSDWRDCWNNLGITDNHF